MRRLVIVSALIVTALTLASCGGDSTPAPDVAATETRAAEQTEVAAVQTGQQATATPEPTNTPKPAATATATATAEPTATADPTETPKPTATPTPIRPTATPWPTRTPTPEPTPTLTVDEAKAQYRADLDVREVDKNVDAYYDWKLYYEGSVLTISQSSTGTLVQVQVRYPGGSDFDRIVIAVLYEDEHAGDGIFEDDNIAIWGRPVTYFEFTNALGGRVAQPLFRGDYIEKR